MLRASGSDTKDSASMATTATPNGGPVKTTLKDSFGSTAEEEEEDDPVSQAVGEFGRWQLQLTFLLSLFNVPCTFHIFAVTFQAPVVDFWCTRPPGFTEMDVPTWRNMSHSVVLSQVNSTGRRANRCPDNCVQCQLRTKTIAPKGMSRWATQNGTPEYDACAVWDMDYNNTAINNVATTNITRLCTDWEFSREEFGDTIISQWNLVCNRQALPNVSRVPSTPLFTALLCCLQWNLVCDRQALPNVSRVPSTPLFTAVLCCLQWNLVCDRQALPNVSRVPSTPLFTAVLCCLQWNLVCDRQALPNVAEMMFLAGVALGGLISGMISDRFGRKKTLMGSLVLQICIALSMTFCPWFEVYVALRFCLGFISVGVVFSGFVLCMELVGGKWRTISGVSYLFPVPLSYIAIAGIAYYVRGWKNLQLAITLPSLLLFGLWWILPESPRWLLAMGRKDEVMLILKEAARVNKRQLPANTDKILQQTRPVASAIYGFRDPSVLVGAEGYFDTDLQTDGIAKTTFSGSKGPDNVDIEFDSVDDHNTSSLREVTRNVACPQMMDMKDPGDEKKAGILDLFRTPNMRKTSLILYIIWFSVYLVYYGLVLNLGKIGGNVYLNTILSGVVEIPAIAISILILLKMGRRGPFCLTLMVSGVACFLTLLVPLGRSDLKWITISLTPMYNHLDVVTGRSYLDWNTISLTPMYNHLDVVTGRSDLEWITISLAMLGKFAVSSSNAVMPVFTAELFPTVVRNLGVGSSNVSAGVALMLVPYLWNLTDIDARVPMGVLGVFGIVGGLSVLLLPETANRPLAETLQEGEDARVMERENHPRSPERDLNLDLPVLGRGQVSCLEERAEATATDHLPNETDNKRSVPRCVYIAMNVQRRIVSSSLIIFKNEIMALTSSKGWECFERDKTQENISEGNI
uniref:Major facilitator superfamily (MFS) profile domain-containing protein n=1 Tax=Timema bartmani TaxID=61472 RepID=A0A7R9HXQ7_9NEOP|nr:unnamed protein product [Timema bartmani]